MVRGTRDGQICPHRLLEDFGTGFCLGTCQGFLGGFIKGSWHAPRREKFYGGISLAIKRSPQLASNFALWTGIFGIGQCTMQSLTGVDSIPNQVISAALAGGILNIRGGWSFFVRGAAGGAVLIGLMGLGEVAMIKYQLKQKVDIVNKMTLYQQDFELQRLKEQNPAMFGNVKTMDEDDLEMLKMELEKLTGEKQPY